MKTRLPVLISLFVALLGLPIAGHADDIDIYAGLGSAANAPNLMFVIDTAANNDANFGTCYYDQTAFGDQAGGTPSNGSDTLGNNQCALYNVAKFLPTRPVTDPTTGVTTQVAMMRLGITTSDGIYFPLAPMDDNTYTGPTTLKIGGNTVSITATTNRAAFLQAVTQLQKHTALVDYGDMMQETWAYYTGGDGTFSSSAIGTINTAVGMISGTTFSGTTAKTGCQKNYVVFIGATSSSSHVNDAGNTWNELYASVYNYENGLVTAGLISQTLANANITKFTTLIATGAQPDKYVYNPNGTPSNTPASWAREWAQFMYVDDVNSSGAGTQDIVTYSISIGSGGNNINVDQDNFIYDLAQFGGGKYFNVSSYSDLYNAILKVLNEVQAVNSVFSSSSLPVSVNAQGTYLNQIFMGMFRPDAEAAPRWMGNLKQYQFIYDPTTASLHLGDSLGNLALSSSGTGFISPNAVSFWTCANLSSTPYADSYLTNNLTSSQVTLMKNDAQNCSLDPTKGFWASDPSAATALAQGFDVPDGEHVERGGAAQRIRNFNLTDDYTQAAGSTANPRKIYTYCPSGSGCVGNLTDASNVFAPSNSGITASMFGTTVTNNIASVTRTGSTVTVTTAGEHGFNVNDQVTIANANIANYNGTFAVTSVPNLTTFTYTLPSGSYTPASASGSYVSVDNNQITFYNLSSLAITSRTISTTDGTVIATVTGTPAVATGFVAGNTVTIQNVTPSNYDGTYTIQSASSTSPYAFTYNITETPPAAAGGSTATSAVATGYTNASCKASSSASVNIGIINTATPSSSGVYRNPNSSPTTVTFTTTSSISAWRASCGITVSGVVDSYGNPVNRYNGAFTTTGNSLAIGGSGNTFTITIASVTPTSPATNVTGLTMQAGAAAMLPVTLSLTDIANANPPAATVTATTGSANTYAAGDTVSIGDKPGVTNNPPSEAPYKGNFPILSTPAPSSPTFYYQIYTLPANPSALAGTTMTASRSTGFNSTDMTNLINWVRGMDNAGDEASLCPGGALNALPKKNYSNCPSPAVTVRPSVGGDVLHSRPTVLNYGAHTVTITSTSDSNGVRTAVASVADVANISNSDTTPVVTFANYQMCPVAVASSTTFTYSATGCGNAGAQTAFVGSKIVVFYGDNGGIFHAVNGEQMASQYGVGPGQELWGFIPQETFYLKLARLRNNSPQLDLPSTPPGISPTPTGKDYFIDGTTGVYQAIDANGNTVRAVLYLSMRRGGHFIYAIDVTDPTNPTVLWKVDPTGLTKPGGFTSISAYSELGQTWSQPKVAWVRGYTTSTDPLTGRAVPVVLFGGGYDKNEDNEPEVAADTQGRAIFALDALTGALVWEATTSGGAATSCGTGSSSTCKVNGMNYAIAADLTLVDRNTDGYVDRIYAADVGGNIWRVDLEPGCNSSYPCSTDDPTHWNVTQFAALGCNSGACADPASPTQRKFFYPPEIIPASTAANFDALVAGSGDREHPLYVSSSSQSANALFLLEDTAKGDTANTTTLTMTGTYPLDNCTNQTACVLANGTSTTSSWGQLTAANQFNGYYISLAAGEKVVNAPLAVAGIVYVSTNTPPAPNSNSCTTALGTAIGYQLSPYSGIATHIVFDGGGLPPSPVAGVVNVVVGGQVKAVPFIIGGGNPNCVGPDCTSALGGQKPNIAVPTTRTRNYWYVKGK